MEFGIKWNCTSILYSGMTFTTQQDKDEHKKLEHKEHREPSGVG